MSSLKPNISAVKNDKSLPNSFSNIAHSILFIHSLLFPYSKRKNTFKSDFNAFYLIDSGQNSQTVKYCFKKERFN